MSLSRLPSAWHGLDLTTAQSSSEYTIQEQQHPVLTEIPEEEAWMEDEQPVEKERFPILTRQYFNKQLDAFEARFLLTNIRDSIDEYKNMVVQRKDCKERTNELRKLRTINHMRLSRCNDGKMLFYFCPTNVDIQWKLLYLADCDNHSYLKEFIDPNADNNCEKVSLQYKDLLVDILKKKCKKTYRFSVKNDTFVVKKLFATPVLKRGRDVHLNGVGVLAIR